MATRSVIDAVRAAIEADVRAGRRVCLQTIAKRVDCSRATVSRLVNHGLPASSASAGAEPLRLLIPRRSRPQTEIEPDAAGARSDQLRGRLLGQAERCADRVDGILRDPAATPAALDQAVKVVVALAGAVDKLRAPSGTGKRAKAEPDAPAAPAPPPPAAVDEAAIAAAVAAEDDNPEPRGYETEVV